jgi:spermidine synthase
MKPFHTIAQTRAPDGALLSLHEHDGEWHLKLNSRELMSTTSTASELLLGELACEHLGSYKTPRVLIGGLGFGFSLKAVLERVGHGAEVHVAELLPDVVAWNREFLGKVNGTLLDDRRVKVFTEDVFHVIKRAGETSGTGYDAILLDVDNGPTSFVQAKNSRLYDRPGFSRLQRALRVNGRVAFWSATEEPQFLRQLAKAGFAGREVEAKAHERAKRFAHRIYVATIAPPEPAAD